MVAKEEVEKLGTLGLIPIHDNDNAQIDIIAIHGLGANPAWAWIRKVPSTESGGEEQLVHWLKDPDMLPASLPNARILAFNYESKWHENAPHTRLLGVAEQLLLAIHGLRSREEKTINRPIIFVGHSFGGIVAEKAAVEANKENRRYKSIAMATIGFLFLGTPFSGSSSVSWGKMLCTAAQCFGATTNDALLKTLSEDSETLQELLHDFLIWRNQYSVDLRCAYETHDTDYGRRLGVPWRTHVVPQKSAVIAGCNTKFEMPTDHFKINKFESPEDFCYSLVRDQLLDMSKGAAEKVNRRLRPPPLVQDDARIPIANLECQKALFLTHAPAELDRIRRRLGDRVEGTCEWILVTEKYAEWSVGSCPRLLRLVGRPGMGKSMIASFLVEQFQKKLGNTPNMILAYHFCDNKNNKTNTATAILRGLLVQIFQQCPEMFRHIQRHFDLKGPDLFDDFEHLWQITLAILKDYKQGEIYLLVDALDECDEDSRNRFLKSIRRMPQQDVNVRTLITCRPEDDIEEIFRDSPNSLYIKLEDINSDLARYMDVRVRELVERKQWTEKEERMIKDALLANAKGIFLWAAFVLKDIEDIKRVYHIPTKLQNLPKDLTEIYERMVNGVKEEDRKVTDMVLKIVVAARRPLKKVELSMAYLMAMDSPDIWDEGIQPPNERLEQHKNEYQCCGLLLQVDEDNDTVNLVHQSAKDYLVDLYLADKDNNGNRIPARLNNVLLEICFRYMALGDLNFLARRMVFETEWDVDWEPKWWELEQDFVFLSYIGKEWEAHAIAAEHDDQRKLSRIPTLLEFRQHTLNSWLRRTTNAYPTNEPAHISELKGQERAKEVRSWEEAKKRALTITKWLISVGASLSAGDFRGLTPLHIAAREGHVDLIPLFIDSGADVNAAPPDLDGRTPLQIAAQKGHLHVIELLLQMGANIDAPAAAIRGRTALQAAAENAQVEAVELLLESGADPNSPAAGFQGVTALLAGTGGSGEYQLGTATHRIIKPRNGPAEGDAAVAQIAREDEEEAQQKALLEKKHEQIVALLLDHDAKTDTADPFGWTPLHAAAERGSLDMTKRLLAKGARINAEARHLGTPLRAAIAKQNFDVADFLETKGAIDKRQKSKIDPDSMMKYIRAVVSRILINSNSQRYYYIQSYIPIYHIIHTYCNEPTDMSMPYDPSSGAGLRGEWMYRSLETLLLDYMERMSPYLAKIRQEDFLMCYIREWTLFNRCAYYMNRMMRYLNRHWIKREMDEGKLGVYPVWELFGVRWRTGLQADVRSKINQAWVTMGETEQGGGGADPRIKTALYESLGSNNTNKDFVLVEREVDALALSESALHPELSRNMLTMFRDFAHYYPSGLESTLLPAIKSSVTSWKSGTRWRELVKQGQEGLEEEYAQPTFEVLFNLDGVADRDLKTVGNFVRAVVEKKGESAVGKLVNQLKDRRTIGGATPWVEPDLTA